jgi:hypothetical protein
MYFFITESVLYRTFVFLNTDSPVSSIGSRLSGRYLVMLQVAYFKILVAVTSENGTAFAVHFRSNVHGNPMELFIKCNDYSVNIRK